MSTEGFWQHLYPSPAGNPADLPGPPYTDRFPVPVGDGLLLDLPLRTLPEGDHAVASIIINQASFVVVDRFADALAALGRGLAPDVVVGLPTLGLTLAPKVAERLGHAHYVPMGYSRKFWYDEALSEPVSSVTTPTQPKRLYLDPNLIPRLAGKRVVIVDDVVSRGTTVTAARRVLDRAGAATVGALAIMGQTERWKSVLDGLPVRTVFSTPLFERRGDGWWPVAPEPR